MKRTAIFAIALLAGCSTAAAISDGIAKACADALPVVNAVAPIVSADATAAMVVGSLNGACTVNGQVQLTLNDQAPVTATNSGNGAAWIAQSVAFLQGLAKAKTAN